MFRKMLVMMLLSALAAVGGLGGCVESPDISPCDARVTACHNKCFKDGLDSPCHACCDNNAASCKDGGDYSFSSCPDAQ